MTQNDPDIEALVGDWLTMDQAADALNTSPNHVKQMIRERKLAAVRRGGTWNVPAMFIADGQILKGLPGTLTVLADCGFSDGEALRWLFTADDSLPGAPVQAMAQDRGTEVRRRAQALAF